jgi:hypothetical protein
MTEFRGVEQMESQGFKLGIVDYDDQTTDNWPTVLFQRRHFTSLAAELRLDGHDVAELDFRVGDKQRHLPAGLCKIARRSGACDISVAPASIAAQESKFGVCAPALERISVTMLLASPNKTLALNHKTGRPRSIKGVRPMLLLGRLKGNF